MSMSDHLTRSSASRGKSDAIYKVIQTPLKQLHKYGTCCTTVSVCYLEITAELPFKNTIYSLCALLLAQLRAVGGQLAPTRLPVLPWGIAAPLYSTPCSVATLSF